MTGFRFLAFAALLVAAIPPALAEMPGTPAELRPSTVRPLGTYEAWQASTGETGDGVALCTAISFANNGAATLSVSTYRGGVSRQVSVVLLDRPGDRKVSLFLEQAGFDMVSRSGAYTHWMGSPEAEAAALERLATGTVAFAAITAPDGSVSYERFNLSGFSQAVTALSEACPPATASDGEEMERHGVFSIARVTGPDPGQLVCHATAVLAGSPGAQLVIGAAPDSAGHLVGIDAGRQPPGARVVAVLGDRRFATYSFGDMRLLWPADAGDFLDRLKSGIGLTVEVEPAGNAIGQTPTEGAEAAITAIDRCGVELEAATP